MAASSSDKFRKVARKWVGQVGSGGVSDAVVTTLPLAAGSGLPTDTGVDLVFQRVDSSGTKTPTLEETAVVVISGDNGTNALRGEEGTAQAHAAGTVVENLITANGWNDIIDGILVDHDQAGRHKNLTDANGNEWIKQTATTSAVNEFTVANAAANNGPTLSATGSDTDIDINITPKGAGEVSITSGDLKIATGANIQVNNADPKRAFYIPASAMLSATTNGPASGQSESTTNKVNYATLDFDKDTDELAHFGIMSPAYWDAGTVTATVYWTAAAGTASETVSWCVQGMSFANDDALDQAYGTAVAVADALIATGDVHVTSATSAITIGGTPTAGDWLQFRIYRDVSEDNLAADAKLLGVRIEFGVAKFTDA